MSILEPRWKPIYAPSLRPWLVALLLALLPSCSTTGGVPTPVLEPVLPNEACLQPAEPLPDLLEPSLAAAIRNHLAVADLYWQLAARQDCLIQFERGRK